MIFNLLTIELFADNGYFLKKMCCPSNSRWNKPHTSVHFKYRMFPHRENPVSNTSLLSDKAIVQLIATDAQTCFQADIIQNNLIIAYQ